MSIGPGLDTLRGLCRSGVLMAVLLLVVMGYDRVGVVGGGDGEVGGHGGGSGGGRGLLMTMLLLVPAASWNP